MHLRTKLTLGILTVTFVVFLAVGFVAIPAAKHALRDRIDDRLRADLPEIRASVLAAGGDVPGGALEGGSPVGGSPGGGAGPDERGYALVVIEGATATVLATPGTSAPPDLRGITAPARGGEIRYVTAPDGTTYRCATTDLGDGRLLAVAAPVDDLAGLVDDLIGTFIVIGTGGAAALAVLAWLWIRHGTRQIEHLTRRAEAIAHGDPDRSLAVAATTTELRQLSHALDAMVTSIDQSLVAQTRSEARLREFIANASHELRTPLTSVSGYLQLDLDGAFADGEHHQRSMRRALGEASRMRRIVTDLQLLTELDENPLPTAAEVDINPLLRDAVHDMRTLDPTRTWTLDLPAQPLVVAGDAHQLRQVVTNLLVNVRVHTPPATVTTARASPGNGSIVIEVSDDGPGLPAEDLERVFDRFWRHDPSRSRASGGSGLGLSIVAAVVSAHGGAAEAAHAPDGGLTIRIMLPGSGGPPRRP
ncbi:sensor histidine kinase [Parafrankia sp. FMc2]|uniref:sensor histidine kinase n=1 Tax=Parafrankia sp. FMc2 TaxID=3233196 RepID=UPI0034D634F3